MYPRWKGKLIVPTRAAQDKMDFEGLDLFLLSELIEKGKIAGKARKAGIIEIIASRKGRGYKIVLAESFRYLEKEIVWLIIHVKSVKN